MGDFSKMFGALLAVMSLALFMLYFQIEAEDTKMPRSYSSNNCIISNNTDINSRSHKSCLKKLDQSEETDCDIPCQESIQRYRKLNTKRACLSNALSFSPSIWNEEGNLRGSQKRRLHHLYSIENSSLIFCYVPKNGCTVWKRILLTITGHIPSPRFEIDDVHRLFQEKVKSLKQYNVTEAQKRLKTYKKFFFVREPMERLLSLFLDKAVNERRFPFKEYQFEGFLKFILDQPFEARKIAEHWAPAYDLCLPCDVEYDFIGRVETSKRDTQYIFDHLIQENRDRLTIYHEANHNTNSSDPAKKSKYFQQVGSWVLTKSIYKYKFEYILFNYDKPYRWPWSWLSWVVG